MDNRLFKKRLWRESTDKIISFIVQPTNDSMKKPTFYFTLHKLTFIYNAGWKMCRANSFGSCLHDRWIKIPEPLSQDSKKEELDFLSHHFSDWLCVNYGYKATKTWQQKVCCKQILTITFGIWKTYSTQQKNKSFRPRIHHKSKCW